MHRERRICSVLIPSYNAGEFVAEAVDSAVAQTYPRVEVIVVDDGSTDDTSERLEPYRDRVTYLSQPNRGTGAARNRALQVASGDYIALLDADDYWAPTRLERIIGLLDSRPDIGFASSDAYIVRNHENTDQTFYGLNRLPRGWATDQARLILQYNFFFGSAVIRRSLFDKHGNFEESLRAGEEDWELWIRFLSRGERLDLVHEPLAYYRRRTGTLSAIPLDEQGKKSSFIEFVLRRPETQRIPGALGLLPYIRGVEALVRGDAPAARHNFHEALRDPHLLAFRRVKALIGTTAPQLSVRLLRVWRTLRPGH